METKLQHSIPGLLVRGGTSKGFLVRKADFDIPEEKQDEILPDLFGSPDTLQIDGIGGGKSHNSKFITVQKSDQEGVDLEYTYAQVYVTERRVSRNSISANLTSAVGMFAILSGLVSADGDPMTLSIYNRNTRKHLDQTIPLRNGEPDIFGDYAISGINGTGARIETKFLDPGGAVTGSLLPTGNPVDLLNLGTEEIEVSIVDSTRIAVFVRATDLGMTGTELPQEIEANTDALETIDRIREQVSKKIGLDDKHTIAVISKSQNYTTTNGDEIGRDEIDITTRIVSLQPHHAIGVSPAMCLGAATRIPGSLPAMLVSKSEDDPVRIGHPKGTIDIGVEASSGSKPHIESITNYRTARPLLAGTAFYRDPSSDR